MIRSSRVLAVLQARMSSRRLPGKVLRPIEGRPMLGWQLDRARRARRIDSLVVATSTHASDDPIAAFCAAEGFGCWRGDLDDVLGRFVGAVRAWGPCDHVVRLTGDCPLIDPTVIDQLVEHHVAAGNDYSSNFLDRTYPD